MEAYLDNAATTKPFDSVREVMRQTLDRDFGNPSSLHTRGMEAEQYLRKARELLADSLKVSEKELIFTSGGTESNNTALIGCAEGYHRAGNHLVSTVFEHPSIYSTLDYLESERNCQVTYVPVDPLGKVRTEALLDAITPETILVSIMMVNNEVGCVQDIAALSKAIKAKNPNVLLHVDAIQAYGKYRIYPRRMGIDLLSVSGHKIHGPKGIGFLYVRDSVKCRPLLHGGGQEGGRRSGTENVPGIAGMAQAVREIYTGHEEKISHLYQCKKRLYDGVLAMPDTVVNAVGEDFYDTAPHILSVSFAGIKSEVLLHALAERGVYVSSGSACSSHHPGVSGTLKAIGVAPELLDCTLRFSLSVNTTEEEIDYALTQLQGLLPQLRRFRRY